MNSTITIAFKGNSMEGLIKNGDLLKVEVLARPKKIANSDYGRLVLIRDHKEWVVHRVIRLNRQLMTKGDRSLVADENTDSYIWGEVKSIVTHQGALNYPDLNPFFNRLSALISKFHLQRTPRLVRLFSRWTLIGTGKAIRSISFKRPDSQLFLSLLRKKNVSVAPAEIVGLNILAQRHFLASYLYDRLTSKDRENFPGWRETKIKYGFRTQLALQDLARLRSALASEIHLCLLKGASLIHRIYSDPGSRFMSDIDILIRDEDKTLVVTALLNLGYAPMEEDHGPANRCKFMFCKPLLDTELVIELHLKLNWFQVKNIQWKTTQSHILGYHQLEQVDELLYLCIHLAYCHNFQRLFWLTDIYELLSTDEANYNWPQVHKRAQQIKADKALAAVLFAIEQVFDYRPPNQISYKRFTGVNVFITKNFLLDPYQSLLHYTLNKHILQDTILNSFKYDYFRIVLGFKNLLQRKRF